MDEDRGPRRALVRDVPSTYGSCLTPEGREEVIHVDLARRQHQAYCNALRELGLEVVHIPTDEGYPDSCFVEDPAIVVGNIAIISRMGAESRIGEEIAVRSALRDLKEIREIEEPGRLDGGDVMIIDRQVYVGISKRTNLSAANQVRSIASSLGYGVTPVGVKKGLHLKSSCSYIGEDVVVMVPGHIEGSVFTRYERIAVPRSEAYAANCLSLSGTVLVPEGYPTTRRLIEDRGFETISMGMSEFEKCGGGLTCLSVRF